jgi:hypothetical protein
MRDDQPTYASGDFGAAAQVRKAGFARSARMSQAGLHLRGARFSTGYKVTGKPGHVEVRFWDEYKQRALGDVGALNRFGDQIRAAGYQAEYGDPAVPAYFPRLSVLIVTAQEDPRVTALSANAPRRVRRRGRWTYNSDSTRYGVAGWHLDGTPLVIDFMPGYTDCEPSRGMYLLYNWPGREHEPLSTHVGHAMEVAEGEYDALATRLGGEFVNTVTLNPGLSPAERQRRLDIALVVAGWLIGCGCTHDFAYHTPDGGGPHDLPGGRERQYYDVERRYAGRLGESFGVLACSTPGRGSWTLVMPRVNSPTGTSERTDLNVM